MKLKVLTLNCWGVPLPFVCKKRKERFLAIGDEVAKSAYDLAVFQEVWHKGDFETLKRIVGRTFPYSHYFYSGSIGSGLCFFSKHPVMETMYHRFDPNGYVHKIHAEYNRDNDEYVAHRICQSFSVSQFIKFTSGQAQLSLLCGDLNLEPVDLGYKMIRCNGSLKDSWLDKKITKSEDKNGNTCDTPSNSFSGNETRDKYPTGKRIDYILYKAGCDSSVDIEECSVTMGRVPGKPFSFSDHEGVEAVISVDTKAGKVSEDWKSEENLPSLLQESIGIVDIGLKTTTTNRRFFIAFSLACFVIDYFIAVIHIPYPLDYFVTLVRLILTVFMGFGIVQSLIMIRSEVHGLEAGRQDMKNLLQNMH